MIFFKHLMTHLLVTLFISGLCFTHAHAESAIGSLTSVKGEVFINNAEITSDAGIKLNDVIETKHGRATLLLGRETVVHISQNSKIKVDQYLIDSEIEKSSIALGKGKLRALVRSQGTKKAFSIRSRSATMGVRGTQIVVDAPSNLDQPARFATLEGSAVLEIKGAAAPIEVKANDVVQTTGNAGAQATKTQLNTEQTKAAVLTYAKGQGNITTLGQLKEQRDSLSRPQIDSESEAPLKPTTQAPPPPPLVTSQLITKGLTISGTKK